MEFLPKDFSDDESDSDCEEVVIKPQSKGVLEYKEMFDADKLAYIIKHKKDFVNMLRAKCLEKGDPFFGPERYLKKSENGIISVKYKQNNDYGRYFALGGLSLQNFAREIRHTIAGEYYVDVDMVNAHPVLLTHLCKENKINCERLDMYVKNREKYINNIIKKNKNKNREDVKKMILSLINGGYSDFNSFTPNTWLTKFKDEMKDIHENICGIRKDEFKDFSKTTKKDYNIKASFMNTILCDMENNVLQEMINYFAPDCVAVLCFDGIMLPRMSHDLEGCENHIKKYLNISMKLKVKEMNEGFVLPPDIETFDSMKFEWSQSANDVFEKLYEDTLMECMSDETVAKAFVSHINGDMVIVDDEGNGFHWNEKTMLWEAKTAKALMRVITELDVYFTKVISKIREELEKDENDANIKKWWFQIYKDSQRHLKHYKNARGIKDAFFIVSTDLFNPNFCNLLNMKHHLIPTKNNKVVNLKTGEERDRTREDMFSFECPVSYSEGDMSNVHKFVNSIFCENDELIQYMRERMGMYLTGDNVREFDIYHGEGRNGKSTICSMLGSILGSGKFYNTLSSGIFIHNPKLSKVQSSEHTSHKVP
jgi:hypothetical protein